MEKGKYCWCIIGYYPDLQINSAIMVPLNVVPIWEIT